MESPTFRACMSRPGPVVPSPGTILGADLEPGSRERVSRRGLNSTCACASLAPPQFPTRDDPMKNLRSPAILLTLSAVILGLGGLSLAGPVPQAKTAPKASYSGTYSIDTVHSAVIYRVKHLDTSWSFGRFDNFSGTLEVDDKSPEKCSVNLSIEMDSLNTNSKKRDDHLKSPDFFDAVQFPTSTFVSKSVKKTSDKKLTVTGDLELHGVTKPVTLELENTGFSDTKMGVRAGYYGTFTIKRSDFGVSAMTGALGEEVEITVSLEAAQTDAKR